VVSNHSIDTISQVATAWPQQIVFRMVVALGIVERRLGGSVVLC